MRPLDTIEHTLVLIFRHLKYYLVDYVPPQGDVTYRTASDRQQHAAAARLYTPDVSELELLKSDADLVLQPILNQLGMYKLDVFGMERKEYVQSLIRQLKEVKRW